AGAASRRSSAPRQAPDGDRAGRAGDRGDERRPALLPPDQEVCGAAGRLHPGGRPAHAHPQSQAAGHRRAVPRHARGPLPVKALEGKVAIVTGASRGIGRAIALAYAEAGAALALAARSKQDLEETAHLAAPHGRRALVIPTDVSAVGEVEALVARTRKDLGGLDILVNNAGVAKVAPLAETAVEDWRWMLETNLSAVFYGCRAVAPHLIAQQRGKVINVASALGAGGLPGHPLSSAATSLALAPPRTRRPQAARQ